jgi:hypothetical protein
MRKLCIEFRSLPARARALTPAEMSAVYGGCLLSGTACDSDSDCCDGRCLKPTINFVRYIIDLPGTCF